MFRRLLLVVDVLALLAIFAAGFGQPSLSMADVSYGLAVMLFIAVNAYYVAASPPPVFSGFRPCRLFRLWLDAKETELKARSGKP